MAMLPKLKLKALVSFPSNVYGGTGIDVTKANGNFTVDLNYSEFSPAVDMPPNSYTLVWSPIGNNFTLVPPSATGGISDAPGDGKTYGRKSSTWVDAWASPILTGNPTAPTPAPLDNDTSIATTAFVAAAVAGSSGVAPMAAFTLKGNNTGASAIPTDVNIAALTTKSSPGGGDFLLLSDQAASGAWKKVAISTMPGSSGGVPEAPNDGQLYGRQSLGWVVASGTTSPSNALPLVAGIANAGTSVLYSRGDHVHPSPTAAALTKTDDANVTVTLGGAPAAALVQAASLTMGWAGTLSTARGGLGANNSAANGVPLFTSGTAAMTGATGTGNFVRAADPVFTGNPTAPTPTAGDNDNSIATTAFVGTEIANKAVRYDTAQSLTAPQQSQARSNIAVPGANVVINGDFRINQGGYVSAAVLAAGLYGHDQWKAGASGGDYSFTQLKSSTQITIAAGKSLIQPIEDINVAGGSYVLSWTGTAQARAGVNTLTPSGTYAASPLLISGQTAGTVMSVEFNAGTLGTVKLESGSLVTPFVMRPYDQELVTCRRYWQPSSPVIGQFTEVYPDVAGFSIPFIPPMRTSPAVAVVHPLASDAGGTGGVSRAFVGSSDIVEVSASNVDYRGASVYLRVSPIGVINVIASMYADTLSFNARL